MKATRLAVLAAVSLAIAGTVGWLLPRDGNGPPSPPAAGPENQGGADAAEGNPVMPGPAGDPSSPSPPSGAKSEHEENGLLWGRVVADSGSPVRDAEVLVWRDDMPETGRDLSDEEGRFTISGLPDGRYRLAVKVPELLQPVIVDVGIPARGPIEVRVPRGFDIAGRVVGIDGEALPGVSVGVAVARPDGRRLPPHLGSARSGEDGRFALKGLAEGRYALFPNLRGTRFEIPHDVVAGSDDVLIHAAPGCTILGTVVDAEGRGLPGVRVTAGLLPGAVPPALTPPFRAHSATTNEKGEFRFSWLPTCALRIEAHHVDFAPATIDLVEGDQTGLELVLSEALLTLAGQVVGKDGVPVAGAYVEAVGETNSKLARAVKAGPDGRFLIRGLPAGLYVLRAGTAGVQGSLEHVLAGSDDVVVVIDSP